MSPQWRRFDIWGALSGKETSSYEGCQHGCTKGDKSLGDEAAKSLGVARETCEHVTAPNLVCTPCAVPMDARRLLAHIHPDFARQRVDISRKDRG